MHAHVQICVFLFSILLPFNLLSPTKDSILYMVFCALHFNLTVYPGYYSITLFGDLHFLMAMYDLLCGYNIESLLGQSFAGNNVQQIIVCHFVLVPGVLVG